MSIEARLERILHNQLEMRREMAELRALLLSRLPPLPDDRYEDAGSDPPLEADPVLEAQLERAYRPARRGNLSATSIGQDR